MFIPKMNEKTKEMDCIKKFSGRFERGTVLCCSGWFVLLLLVSSFHARSQILEPAKWDYAVGPKGDMQIGDVIALSFTVKLDEDWYIYSPDQDPDLGPVPTSVRFEDSDGYKAIGGSRPREVVEKYDDVWKGEVRIIETSGGGLDQKVKILKPNPTIRGTIIYTVCSEETGQCIFPEEDFEINIKTTDKK